MYTIKKECTTFQVRITQKMKGSFATFLGNKLKRWMSAELKKVNATYTTHSWIFKKNNNLLK